MLTGLKMQISNVVLGELRIVFRLNIDNIKLSPDLETYLS
jgi:hypothetical protein